MQVQSVQSVKSNIGFKSNENFEKAEAFVNMNDEQLKRLAFRIGYNRKEEKEKNKKTLQRTFWAIPVVDIIANGALAKNALITEDANVAALFIDKATPLSTKANAAIRTAGTWGLILAVYGIYRAARQSFVQQNSQDDRQKNPIASLFMDVAVIMGGLVLASMGMKSVMAQNPEKTDKMLEKYNNWLKKFDKSEVNTKVLPEIERLAKESPRLAAVGKVALAFSTWIVLGLGLYKVYENSMEQRRKVDRTYRELKTAQTKTAALLTKVLSKKENIVKKQIKLAKGLKIVIKDKKFELDKAMFELDKKIRNFEEEKEEVKVKKDEIIKKFDKTGSKDFEKALED